MDFVLNCQLCKCNITNVMFPQNAFDERNKELVKKTTFTSIIEDKDCEEECVGESF